MINRRIFFLENGKLNVVTNEMFVSGNLIVYISYNELYIP